LVTSFSGKLLKIVATRCHFEVKMHQIRFWLGELTALHQTL